MTNNQNPHPDRDGALLVPSTHLKTLAPASSPAPGTGVYTKPAAKSDPMLGPPAAATTASRPTQPPLRFVEYQIPGGGPILHTVMADNRCYTVIGDVAEATGLPVTDITELPDSVTTTRFGLPAMRSSPAFRNFKIGGIVYRCVDVEAWLPLCKKIPGGDYLARYLLQWVLPLGSAIQVLGLNERVPHGQFTTAAGQFVSQRFYRPRVGEIRAIVTGTTVWIAAGSIARIMGVSPGMVIHLAGPGNFLRIPGKYLLSPVDPDRCETYIRTDAATRVLKAGESWRWLAVEIEDWIVDALLIPAKLREAGAVVSIRRLQRVLDPAADFDGWINALVGPTRALVYLSPCTSDSIPVTIAKSLVEKSNYRNWVVSLLLQDGGVCHGGSVGETADEALVRIRQLFPDENGQVSARALYAFLGSKRTFEAWLGAYSDHYPLGQVGSKRVARVRGDVFLSEIDALMILLRNIEDPADFRTTLRPSNKL